MKSRLSIFVSALVLVLSLLATNNLSANEDKFDGKKGEGIYNVAGVPMVKIFDVGQKNLTNDVATTIEGKVRNISGHSLSLVSVDVAFYEKDHTRIEVDTDTLTTLSDQEVARFKVDQPEGAFFFKVISIHVTQ